MMRPAATTELQADRRGKYTIAGEHFMMYAGRRHSNVASESRCMIKS